MKHSLGLCTLLTIAALLGFGIYLGVTWTPLFRGVDILFYRGLLLCGVSAVLLGLLLTAANRYLKTMESATIIAAVAISLSFNLVFLIVLPVTIDRSVSVFMLAEIEARQASAPDTAQLEDGFVQHYVHDMRQIDRRVHEQALSGNITVSDGKIQLTSRGRRFLDLARLLARLFRTDPRFVGLAPPLSGRTVWLNKFQSLPPKAGGRATSAERPAR